MPELLLALLLLVVVAYFIRHEFREETVEDDSSHAPSPSPPASEAKNAQTISVPEPPVSRPEPNPLLPEPSVAPPAIDVPPRPPPLLVPSLTLPEWKVTPDIDWDAATASLHHLHRAGLLRHVGTEQDLRVLAQEHEMVGSWAAAQQRPLSRRHPWLAPSLLQRLGENEPLDAMRLYLAPAPGRDVYVAALSRWAALTGGEIVLEEVEEKWDGPDGPVTVSFTLNGRSGRLTPRVQGPWFDLGIVGDLNASLKTSGGRFYAWTAAPILDHTFVFWLTSDQAATLTETQGWRFAELPPLLPGHVPKPIRPAETLASALARPRPTPTDMLPAPLREAGIDPAPLHHLLTAGGRDFYGYTIEKGSPRELWAAFRTAHPQTGYWPLLFSDLDIPADAVSRHYARATQTPEEIVAAAARLRVDDVVDLESGPSNHLAAKAATLPDRRRGVTYTDPFPPPVESDRRAYDLFLVPAGAPWEVPAVLQLEAANAFLAAVEQVVLLYHWHALYGAEPVTLLFAVAEFVVDHPPHGPAAALRLLLEQEIYCADLYQSQPGDILDRAAWLLATPYWHFWWD